ncbi:MAG: DUF4282 domain-containing protein [Asticcacaulis sp.]|nr:DUF4282 domain-containing protein [Asticcacaulis sp.]
MQRTIRQVFGTTRPRDIWLNLFTFDQLLTRPIIHIVYWCGLGLLFIGALGWAGIMVGTGIKDASIMGWLLSFGLLVVGFLGFMIAVLAWRSVCELYMAVMNIAEDLRYLRQFQEKLTPQNFVAPAAPVAPEPVAAPDVAAVAEPAAQNGSKDNILEDPFFRPRFERKDL